MEEYTIKDIRLFDEMKRTEKRPKNRNENIYDYLNLSARKTVIESRNYLEKLFDIFPEKEKKEMKQRFKIGNHFESALFELFLYHIFKKNNYIIELHPTLERTPNKPDFLLKKQKEKIYLEAKVDYNKSTKEKSFENMINQIKDTINRLVFNNYKIELEKLEIKSKGSPSLKAFKDDFREKISNLEKNNLEAVTKDIKILDSYLYQDDNLSIKYKIYRVTENYKDKRLIQIDSSEPPTWIDSKNSIKKSLESKASRYNIPEAPFVIALNYLDLFLDDDDIDTALHGDKQLEIAINQETSEVILFKEKIINNGFFSMKEISKHSNISAVLIYNMNLGNIKNPNCWFIENPNADYPVNSKFRSIF